jgi:hypothetical protein
MKRFVTTAVLMASALLLGGISQIIAAETVQLSKDQVKELIGSAKTAGDHQKLAAYYRGEADKLEAEAKDHEELATAYRNRTDAVAQKHTMSGKTAGHCDHFAKSVREAAKADRELAVEHELMAKGTGK